MAKDTEKLIRQLSLISFLMAERRSVTALEIKQEVEGYSGMNDDAFARRFYADRAELESLGIDLKVDKPADGSYEAESYTLPPENFYLPAIEFSDAELGALRMALSLLDGEFAYAEPLRLALQQLSWGKPSPLGAADNQPVALAQTAEAGGRELSQRLSKIETAIFRRKTIVFDYYTIGRDAEEKRKVDPYQLLYQRGQFYLIGYSHERQDIRVFRLSRIRGKVSYSSKAEHDFSRPEDFDHRWYATRTDWQLGEPEGTARIWLSSRVDWLIERHYGHAGTLEPAADADDAPDDGSVFETEYADPRAIVAWVLELGERARLLGPPELVDLAAERLELIVERHGGTFETAKPKARQSERPVAEPDEGKGESPIRPERFARLVTLASILIKAAREGTKLDLAPLCEQLNVTEQELQEDIDVLNVVNFGGGSYVVYAEVVGDTIEVDPEPYGDNFARPARLLPLQAKALVAAIDLIGEHIPEGSLESARKKITDALGQDPAQDGLQITRAKGDDSDVARVLSEGIVGQPPRRDRVLQGERGRLHRSARSSRTSSPTAARAGTSSRTTSSATTRARSGSTGSARRRCPTKEFEPREGVEADTRGWLRTGEVEGSQVARIWWSPERARWAREDKRVVEELKDGAVIVEQPFQGADWLVHQILSLGGDAVVLEPEEARAAVLEGAEALAGLARS